MKFIQTSPHVSLTFSESIKILRIFGNLIAAINYIKIIKSGSSEGVKHLTNKKTPNNIKIKKFHSQFLE